MDYEDLEIKAHFLEYQHEKLKEKVREMLSALHVIFCGEPLTNKQEVLAYQEKCRVYFRTQEELEEMVK